MTANNISSEPQATLPVWVPGFLKAFRKSANVAEACRAAGISRQAAYEYRKNHEGFAQMWDEAENDAVDSIEAVAWKRARDGVVTRRKVWYDRDGNKCTETETHYSDTLAIFLLKAHRPTMYRETTNQNINMNLGGQVELYIPDNGRDGDLNGDGDGDGSGGTTAGAAEDGFAAADEPGEISQLER